MGWVARLRPAAARTRWTTPWPVIASIFLWLGFLNPAFASFIVGYNTIPGAGGSFALGTGSTFTNGAYTMPQTGVLQSVSYWAPGATGGNNFLGVYQDNGSNKPGTLLATSAANTIASGWNTWAMTTNPTITSGTKIWFAILPVTVSPTFRNDSGQPSNTAWYDTAGGDTTLPGPFAGTNTFTNSTGGLYATFNPVSGITFGATTAGTHCTGTCAMVINVPAGTVNGDLLILAETIAANGCTTPTNWIPITSNNYVTGSSTACMYYRIAKSEPASYTLPSQSLPQAFMNDYHGTSGPIPINQSSNNFTLGHTVTTPVVQETQVPGEWYVGYSACDSTTNAMVNTTGDLVDKTVVSGSTNNWDAGIGDKPTTPNSTEIWTDTGATTGCFGLGVTILPLAPIAVPSMLPLFGMNAGGSKSSASLLLQNTSAILTEAGAELYL